MISKLLIFIAIVFYFLGFFSVGVTEKGRDFFSDLGEKLRGIFGNKTEEQ